jgi:hypothetical protein
MGQNRHCQAVILQFPALPYLITPSAMASSVGGTVRPRLMVLQAHRPHQ